MTEPEITPGPWEIEKCQCGHSACRSYLVSAIGSDGRCSLADAQIIAAAPDMYKVLETVASYLESFKDQWLEGDELLYCGVTGALNKVTGGTRNDSQ